MLVLICGSLEFIHIGTISTDATLGFIEYACVESRLTQLGTGREPKEGVRRPEGKLDENRG